MNNMLVRISILSISLLTVMASAAISPALAKISQAFPGTDPTLIKLVLTLPSLLIIPFSLLGGWLASRMKKKYILLIGLVIYFLGGVGGGLAQSITQLLIIRGLFGIGVGLIIPLSISLIADFYEKEERAKMMGLSGSVSHFGGVVFLLLSGWLACMNWRYAFGVYGLSLLIMLTVFFWLPEPESKKPSGLVKSKLPGGVFVCAVLGALMMVAFYAAPTNLAMFIENERAMYTSTTPLFKDKAELEANLAQGTISQTTVESFKNNGIAISEKAAFAVEEPGKRWSIVDKNKKYIVTKQKDGLVVSSERMGRPGIAGYFLSAMTLVGVVSGIILAMLLRLFGPYCSVIGIAAMSIGYSLLGCASSLTLVLISMLCIGFSSGILMPLLLLRAAKITPEASRAFAMAVVSVGIYLGQFLSPVILKMASSFPGQDAFRSQFNFLSMSLAAATVVGLFSAVKTVRQGGFKQYAAAKPMH
ncbi:MAG TPA: MFS transporter [Candidatus Omnitrophota bacterium]|nr:MFS transporter [Candidatus Omnitrophota bacterium]HPD84842.1 MFS transporter [Candidatus Omnitrophota bacterium]HRZ03700.1 MFS transporter [Candidatus Omnitrophota bacterium]